MYIKLSKQLYVNNIMKIDIKNTASERRLHLIFCCHQLAYQLL